MPMDVESSKMDNSSDGDLIAWSLTDMFDYIQSSADLNKSPAKQDESPRNSFTL